MFVTRVGDLSLGAGDSYPAHRATGLDYGDAAFPLTLPAGTSPRRAAVLASAAPVAVLAGAEAQAGHVLRPERLPAAEAAAPADSADDAGRVVVRVSTDSRRTRPSNGHGCGSVKPLAKG